MPVINLKQLKIDEPTRNFDSSLDENINISAENNQGLFGAFKFFAGIRSFFKGISALGTLASGSRLPVTDSNGNVTYTTMNDINNYVVNNALTNYDKITKVYNLSSYTYNKVYEYIKDNWTSIPNGKSSYLLSTNATGTANVVSCEITKQSDTFGECLVHSYYGDKIMINYNGTWSINNIATETDNNSVIKQNVRVYNQATNTYEVKDIPKGNYLVVITSMYTLGSGKVYLGLLCYNTSVTNLSEISNNGVTVSLNGNVITVSNASHIDVTLIQLTKFE